jgi:hypothetical protein
LSVLDARSLSPVFGGPGGVDLGEENRM